MDFLSREAVDDSMPNIEIEYFLLKIEISAKMKGRPLQNKSNI